MAKRFLNSNYNSFESKRPKINDSTKINLKYNSSCTNAKNEHIWDDDDDVILLATQVAEEAVNCEQSNRNNLDNTLAKVADVTPALHENTSNSTEIHSKNLKQMATDITGSNTNTNLVAPSTLSSQRRQLASERQIQFLLERVQSFKQEDEKLRNDLSDMRSKLESKEGEATLMREELRLMKQQLHNIKMKNTLQVEASVNERDATIANLSKYVEVKEAEFKLKQVHSMAMKSKCANETQASYQNLTQINKSSTTQKCLMKLGSFNLDLMDAANDINSSIFSTIHNIRCTDNGNIFQLELQRIKNLLINLQLSPKQKFPFAIEICLTSFSKVITELFSYCHNLNIKQKCIKSTLSNRLHKTNPSHNRTIQQSKKGNHTILNDYLNTLTVILKRVPTLAQMIVQHKTGKVYLLQIVTETISKLCSIPEIPEYNITMKALSSMLVCILQLLPSSIDPNHMIILINLLKQVVHSLPESYAHAEISACLWEACHLSGFLDLLCVNQSPQKPASSATALSNYPPASSCFIQIYCDILPTVFNSNLQFKSLCSVCLNHMRFVHHCFTQPPKFVYKHLTSFDLETDDLNENSNHDNTSSSRRTNESSECDCYYKLILSMSTLLFRLLKLWLNNESKQSADWISRIACLSVYTLHTIFRDYDLSNCFHYLQDATKHQLHTINKWLLANSKILKLDELTVAFLTKLNQSNIAFKASKNDINLDNLVTALHEWQQLTNDIDNVHVMSNNNNDNKKNNGLIGKLQIFEKDALEQTYFSGLQLDNASHS